MGLSQTPGEPATTSPPTQTSSTTTKPPSASDLPPEALALATRLFEYARQGQTSELSQYVSAGIPVNLTNHKGDTLIMLAAYHGHLDTVKTLLEKGADMNVLNDRGQSPIAGAVFKGYDEVVKAMVEKGADLYAGQPNAVDAARMFRREGMLELFRIEP